MTYDLDRDPKTLLSRDARRVPSRRRANAKAAKGEKLGYLTAVLSLSPAELAGVGNMCAHSSASCRAMCLTYSGHGLVGLDEQGLNTIQVARIQRTRLFRADKPAFMTRLVRELAAHERAAAAAGMLPAVRLNGFSDWPFEREPVTRDGTAYANVMRAFPGVRFYDYTKWPLRLRGERGTPGGLPGNYALTFSLDERNEPEAAAALPAGVNVAVVFAVSRGAPLPAGFELGGAVWPVIDGDTHDLRFLDRPGVIVGLRAKGLARNAPADGFVRAA